MPYAFPLPEEAAALFSQYTPRPMGRHFGFWDKPCASAGAGSAGCWPGKEARSRSQPQPLPAMPSPALRQPKGAAEVSCFFSFLYCPWRWLKQQLVGQEMKLEGTITTSESDPAQVAEWSLNDVEGFEAGVNLHYQPPEKVFLWRDQTCLRICPRADAGMNCTKKKV